MDLNSIYLSLIISKTLFSDNYMDMIKVFDNAFSRQILLNLCFNVISNNYVTKIDNEVTQRVYNILSYYRETLKKEKDYQYLNELINDSIGVLNTLKYNDCFYAIEFHQRFNTIYNYYIRISYLIKKYPFTKELVVSSICNDSVLFKDAVKLNDEEFINMHMGNLLSISSIVYLIKNFEELFENKEIMNKFVKLLDSNIDISSNIPIDGDIICSSSDLTRKKILKKINK